jgi:hypothetical protein
MSSNSTTTPASDTPLAHVSPPVVPNYVNSHRGVKPVGLEEGVIPTSPSSFKQWLVRSITVPVNPSSLRRCRTRAVQTAVTRRSSRLAKKALQRMLAMVAAQNVLTRKLGLTIG